MTTHKIMVKCIQNTFIGVDGKESKYAYLTLGKEYQLSEYKNGYIYVYDDCHNGIGRGNQSNIGSYTPTIFEVVQATPESLLGVWYPFEPSRDIIRRDIIPLSDKYEWVIGPWTIVDLTDTIVYEPKKEEIDYLGITRSFF